MTETNNTDLVPTPEQNYSSIVKNCGGASEP